MNITARNFDTCDAPYILKGLMSVYDAMTEDERVAVDPLGGEIENMGVLFELGINIAQDIEEVTDFEKWGDEIGGVFAYEFLEGDEADKFYRSQINALGQEGQSKALTIAFVNNIGILKADATAKAA